MQISYFFFRWSFKKCLSGRMFMKHWRLNFFLFLVIEGDWRLLAMFFLACQFIFELIWNVSVFDESVQVYDNSVCTRIFYFLTKSFTIGCAPSFKTHGLLVFFYCHWYFIFSLFIVLVLLFLGVWEGLGVGKGQTRSGFLKPWGGQ